MPKADKVRCSKTAYSITSLARSKIEVGNVKRAALAVFKLTVSSKLQDGEMETRRRIEACEGLLAHEAPPEAVNEARNYLEGTSYGE